MKANLILQEKPARLKQKLITLSQYVHKYPQGWKKRLELANVLYKMGNWPQAVTEYYQVIERQPQLLNVRLQLGKILQMMRLKKEAIETYEQALLLSKNEGTKHHIKGLIFLCLGESENAIKAFNLAANLESEKIVHWLALAQAHQERENPLGVLSALEQILSIKPDDFVALIYSYDALMAVGNIQAAIEQLNRLIVLAEDDFRILQRQIDRRFQMRLISGKEGKLTKKMITSLLQQIPDGVEAQKSLAYYHIFRGDWGQGVEVLAKFAAEYPNYPYGWYYYGRCLFETGQYKKAAQIMEKAYQLYPHDCEIYRALCEILPAAKKFEELRPVVEEMLSKFPERWSVSALAGRVLVEHFKEIERGCDVLTRLQSVPKSVMKRNIIVAKLLKRAKEQASILVEKPDDEIALDILKNSLENLSEELNTVILFISGAVENVESFENKLPDMATQLNTIASRAIDDSKADRETIDKLHKNIKELENSISSATGAIVGLAIADVAAITLGIVATIIAFPVGAVVWLFVAPAVAAATTFIVLDAIDIKNNQQKIESTQKRITGIEADVASLSLLANVYGNLAKQTTESEANLKQIFNSWHEIHVETQTAIDDIQRAVLHSGQANFESVLKELTEATSEWQKVFEQANALVIDINVTPSVLNVGMSSKDVEKVVGGSQPISVTEYVNRLRL